MLILLLSIFLHYYIADEESTVESDKEESIRDTKLNSFENSLYAENLGQLASDLKPLEFNKIDIGSICCLSILLMHQYSVNEVECMHTSSQHLISMPLTFQVFRLIVVHSKSNCSLVSSLWPQKRQSKSSTLPRF